MPSVKAEPLLTPAEVATMFRVDPKTITRWAKAGKLTSARTLGGHRRYREHEIRELIAASSQERVPDPMAAPVHTLWPIAVTGPAAAVRKRLQAAGIATVGKLVKQDASALRDMGFRRPQVDEIRVALHRKGLALRGEVVDQAA
jgi:excisionase family DNA binding protein